MIVLLFVAQYLDVWEICKPLVPLMLQLDLQRKMLLAYETREKARKVAGC